MSQILMILKQDGRLNQREKGKNRDIVETTHSGTRTTGGDVKAMGKACDALLTPSWLLNANSSFAFSVRTLCHVTKTQYSGK